MNKRSEVEGRDFSVKNSSRFRDILHIQDDFSDFENFRDSIKLDDFLEKFQMVKVV